MTPPEHAEGRPRLRADITSVSGPDYILDLHGAAPRPGGPQPRSPATGRPWLAVHWRCCSVYSRIYRQPEATRYEGRCPRCARQVRINVAPGGVAGRFFEAG